MALNSFPLKLTVTGPSPIHHPQIFTGLSLCKIILSLTIAGKRSCVVPAKEINKVKNNKQLYLVMSVF
jgi:hypothetical protein